MALALPMRISPAWKLNPPVRPTLLPVRIRRLGPSFTKAPSPSVRVPDRAPPKRSSVASAWTPTASVWAPMAMSPLTTAELLATWMRASPARVTSPL